ncbi:MAG: P-loop NTPase [Actinomycetia bacterium]|nr:P-loop NTPase [Actinomycetes bacterium]MCP4961794.1 P-loop NTPase [Actinomycetes bacterium]
MSIVAIISNRRGFDVELRAALGPDGPDIGQIPAGPTASERMIIEALPTGGDLVVLVGPDLDSGQALGLLAMVDQQRPGAATVLVATPSPEVLRQALRLGVRGVVAPNADLSEIAEEITAALKSVMRMRETFAGPAQADPTKRVLSVVSAKGGTGKTTVAANIAVALAVAAPGQVALVDFDLQFGDVEYALRLKPELTIADFGRAGDRVDETSVKAFLTSHPSGVFALCGAATPSEAEELDGTRLARLVQLLKANFRYVVIDTAGGIDDASLVAMDNSTNLLLMSSTDIPSVRAMQKTTQALRSLGLDDRPWHYVLNRSDAKVGLDADDIAEAVGMPIDLAIPDTKTMTMAMNQGAPIVETDPRSAAAKRIAEFVGQFVPREEIEQRGRRLSLGSKR